MDTNTETQDEVEAVDGDRDKFAHYAERGEIMESYVHGIPLVALCGKIWVPYGDPDKYPVCPTCKDIYDATFARFNGGCGND